MTHTNPANMSTNGLQSYNIDTGELVGRTLQEGTNVTITYPDGIGGDPVINAASSGGIIDVTRMIVETDFTGGPESSGTAYTIEGSYDEDWNTYDITTYQTAISGHPGISCPNPSYERGRCFAKWFFTGASNDTNGLCLKCIYKLNTLYVTANTYCIVGFRDNLSYANDITDGIYFRWSNASANWIACTENSGTITATDTGVAGAISWINMEITISQDGSTAYFYINNSLVATNTTNLPATSKALAGGVSFTVHPGHGGNYFVDYLGISQTLNR